MKLNVRETPIKGVKLISIDYFRDKRGFFVETWHKGDYAKAGFKDSFFQDSISSSKKGVVRGLHYQTPDAPMPKLVTCLSGKVFMVALDLRKSSPSFAKHFSIELSEKNKYLLYVSKGIALGMAALSTAMLLYKQASFYKPSAGRTIFWKDPDLGIKWPRIKNPIISEKDNEGISWKDYLKNPDFR